MIDVLIDHRGRKVRDTAETTHDLDSGYKYPSFILSYYFPITNRHIGRLHELN